MQILAVDIGTGTQDVLLFDTEREPENALKMVLPSPTHLLGEMVKAATRAGDDVLLTGVTMGGGPSTWAVDEHLAAGRRVYATPDAARTFNDDLDEVGEMGVVVVSEDEAAALTGVRCLVMRDFDYHALAGAFAHFDVDLDAVDVLALAVFDHGAAPPGVSDRLFRFEYLARRIATGRGLSAFAFVRDDIPPSMTRLRAAAATAPADRTLIVMDTAPAAVLGATEDPRVRAQQGGMVVANVGNMHTLAFHLCGGRIAGLFEHHTGLLNRTELERLLVELAAGIIDHKALYADHGHGALLIEPECEYDQLGFLAITGPRRRLLAGSDLRPHLAVPYGDMMMAGCWGLVRACATVLPWIAEEIEASLGGA